MPLNATWTRVLHAEQGPEAMGSGLVNAGGRLYTTVGRLFPEPFTGDIWYSDDNGLTWTKGAALQPFTDLGMAGSALFNRTSGMLCYEPGRVLRAVDGAGPSSGNDGGGQIFTHTEPNGGTPVFNLSGWSRFGRPCLNNRKDVAGRKFAIWPGEFIYDVFGADPGLYASLLLELTQAGATSLTTAFLLHQLAPGNFYAAPVPNEDGSIQWLWVTEPPLVGSSTGTPQGLFTDGFSFFMLASQDGLIWRPYGDNQQAMSIGKRAQYFSGTPYNACGDAFFLSDGETLLLGVNVSGLSPCLFKSTARGAPGTFKEIVMPGNFFNFIPQGAQAVFLFSGLVVMTYCFCELDDGTLLCGGGAPTSIGVAQGLSTGPSYHYPVLWRSTDKGETWTNISLNIGNFATLLPLSTAAIYESRILLSLGEQRVFLATYIEGAPNDSTWTPFYLSEDGGDTFVKSLPTSRIGMFADGDANNSLSALVPVQATFANDGSILVLMAAWDEGYIEIWRGVLNEQVAPEHRAVGFVEQIEGAPPPSSFALATIPEQELIRG